MDFRGRAGIREAVERIASLEETIREAHEKLKASYDGWTVDVSTRRLLLACFGALDGEVVRMDHDAALLPAPPPATPLTGPELAERYGFPPLAASGAARVPGVPQGEAECRGCTSTFDRDGKGQTWRFDASCPKHGRKAAPLTGPELAERHGFPPLAVSGAARVPGAAQGEAECTCRDEEEEDESCGDIRRYVNSSSCKLHGRAAGKP